jgi:DNA-directed RNA polymerase subunit beta'
MRLVGRISIDKVTDGKSKTAIVKAGELVTTEHLQKLKSAHLDQIRIRSVLSCNTKRGVCKKCYGFDLGFNQPVRMGTSVGIIAAQSIGEPGTQLTMRTFHTGGVAGQDITQGLPRVEELFEARPVRKPAFLADADGVVAIKEDIGQNGEKHKIASLTGIGEERDRFTYPRKGKAELKVEEEQKVKKGDVLFIAGKEKVEATADGIVKIEPDGVVVITQKEKVWEYPIPFGYNLVVKDGAEVLRGDRITEGSIDLHQLYALKGQLAVQKYVIGEIQNIYSTQGQKLNDKHIEIIVRQMFSRVYIRDAGDTDLLSGEILERSHFDEVNANLGKNKKPALADILLLGITKASLAIESFFSAASFQETARVLIDAAVSGKVDQLRGLKENVIIGRLIPAGTGHKDNIAAFAEKKPERPTQEIKEPKKE